MGGWGRRCSLYLPDHGAVVFSSLFTPALFVFALLNHTELEDMEIFV